MTRLSSETLQSMSEAAAAEAGRLLARRQSLVEDVVSDAMVRALRNEELLLTLPAAAQRSWIRTVAARIVFDIFRQEQRGRFAMTVANDPTVIRASYRGARVDPRLWQRTEDVVGLLAGECALATNQPDRLEDHLVPIGVVQLAVATPAAA